MFATNFDKKLKIIARYAKNVLTWGMWYDNIRLVARYAKMKGGRKCG